MTPVPWPLIGRPHATGGTVTPPPPQPRPAARPPVLPPPTGEPHGETTATRYLDPDRPGTGPHMPLWLIAESAVLASLATAGGDLTAHQAVHMEDR